MQDRNAPQKNSSRINKEPAIMADPAPLFTADELKQYRYQCSHKLVVSLTAGAIYLVLVTVFFLDKALKNAAEQDKLHYYGFAAAGYVLLIVLIAMIVRRSQSLNFSRFLRGCVKFDNFGYMLEYVELRMPGPFSPRFLKYPIHLMILGKVLDHSEKPNNVETGRRMIAGAADRDPSLEPFREAPLAELMEYHEKTFLAAHPEMLREWHNAENFHGMLVHYILPVVIIVGIISFILKGCTPPEETEERSLPAAEETRKTDHVPGGAGKDVAAPDAAGNEMKPDIASPVETDVPAVTGQPESAPQG